MRVLVCGGRDYPHAVEVYYQLGKLDREQGVDVVIHGAARGVDAFAKHWGERNNKLVLAFPADWKTHGKKAGPIRNQGMLDGGNPDLVIAFPGGRGTADMVCRAQAAGVPVKQIEK